nr:MAG TPA: hypothetical protein [Caudoviricetes sp.]
MFVVFVLIYKGIGESDSISSRLLPYLYTLIIANWWGLVKHF